MSDNTPNHSRFWKARTVFLGLVILIVAITAANKLTDHVANNKSKGNFHPAKVAIVRVTSKGFEPATLTVEKGTKVIWMNSTEALHQVVANPYPGGSSLPGLKSQILNNSQTYEYTANKSGSFGYHDQLKPTINGTLLVR